MSQQFGQDNARFLAKTYDIIDRFDDHIAFIMENGIGQRKNPIPAYEAQQVADKRFINSPVSITDALIKHT